MKKTWLSIQFVKANTYSVIDETMQHVSIAAPLLVDDLRFRVQVKSKD